MVNLSDEVLSQLRRDLGSEAQLTRSKAILTIKGIISSQFLFSFFLKYFINHHSSFKKKKKKKKLLCVEKNCKNPTQMNWSYGKNLRNWFWSWYLRKRDGKLDMEDSLLWRWCIQWHQRSLNRKHLMRLCQLFVCFLNHFFYWAIYLLNGFFFPFLFFFFFLKKYRNSISVPEDRIRLALVDCFLEFSKVKNYLKSFFFCFQKKKKLKKNKQNDK